MINEERLILMCAQNDRHAQEMLYNQFYKELYLIAMRYLNDHHDTEDAIILSFTKIFKKASTFRFNGPGSLGKWIRTILINESIRLLNKRKQLQFSSDLSPIDNEQPLNNGLETMKAEDILQMIEQLPSGYRTVFNLYVIEGFTHKEIAVLLKISESTSKTQLKKARNRLMTCLKKEEMNGTI